MQTWDIFYRWYNVPIVNGSICFVCCQNHFGIMELVRVETTSGHVKVEKSLVEYGNHHMSLYCSFLLHDPGHKRSGRYQQVWTFWSSGSRLCSISSRFFGSLLVVIMGLLGCYSAPLFHERMVVQEAAPMTRKPSVATAMLVHRVVRDASLAKTLCMSGG